MHQSEAEDRKIIEIALGVDNCRQQTEQLVCKILKAGAKLPQSDQVFKLLCNLRVNCDENLELQGNEVMVTTVIFTGLRLLAQLALVSERM